MPKRTNAPLSFYVVSHGRSPVPIVHYLEGGEDFPKENILRFIGKSTFAETAVSIQSVEVCCDDKKQIYDALEEREPLLLALPDLYLFGKQAWQISKMEQSYTKEQLRLVFLESVDKEREKWERLKRKFSGIAGEAVEYVRKPIPESVRIFVWRRDQGRCVECGSIENLEFDHRIPVSKGGSNTERNIQLLCEACNRTKSAKI